jgi:hypothetical protein
MWRKFAGPDFYPSMFRLTPDQRLAVQKQIEIIATDPHNTALNPIILDSNTREIEVVSIWLRYRIDDNAKRIVFLKASM